MSVVLAAHGSPDLRHAAVVAQIREAVALHLEDVEIGWLGHHEPTLADAVAAASARSGEVAVVPLLLAPAFHARVDVPAGAGTARVAPVLAPDPTLLEALDDRVADSLAADDHQTVPDALVLAAAGSTDPAADSLVREVAEEWASRNQLPVTVAYASSSPGVPDAVRALRAAGASGVAVGAFLVAPGRLHDAVAAQAAALGIGAVAAPLGAHPALVRLVVERARAALERVPG